MNFNQVTDPAAFLSYYNTGPVQPAIPGQYGNNYGAQYQGDAGNSTGNANPKLVPRKCSSTFNVNPLLSTNILNSSYFHSLFSLTFPQTISQITTKVTNLQPFLSSNTTAPSTAFCLLYKLLTVEITKKEWRYMVKHNNFYVRAIGLLYIRYVLPSEMLADYVKEVLDYNASKESDREEIEKGVKWTWDDFVRRVILGQKYLGTVLPRIPKQDEQKLEEILGVEGKREREREVTTSDRREYSKRVVTFKRTISVPLNSKKVSEELNREDNISRERLREVELDEVVSRRQKRSEEEKRRERKRKERKEQLERMYGEDKGSKRSRR